MLRPLSASLEPLPAAERARTVTHALVDRFGAKALGHARIPDAETPPRGLLDTLAPPTRIVELAAGPRSARTTLAVSLVVEAQRAGEPAAWIEPRRGALYPPDLAAAGVDLGALVIVRVPDDERAAPRAAELLLRSGAFGLVVLDLAHVTHPKPSATEAWLGRLSGLARLHESRIVVIGARPVTAPSLGTLVAMRIETTRRRIEDGRFVLEYDAIRHKSHLPPPRGHAEHRAPVGCR